MPRVPTHNDPPAAERFDAVCVGETMVLLTPASGTPLVRRPELSMEIGGAESNVACGLAKRGHRTAWASGVGADPFGRIVTDTLVSHGVDTGLVDVCPHRPTGMYLKDPAESGTRVHYYRSGSAAAAMGPETADTVWAIAPRLVHLSGITPALSATCAALVERLLVDRPPQGPTVVFDVNYRPSLWTRRDAAPVLAGLATAADIVLVGLDEAHALWDTADPAAVRALFPDVPCLVVKDAGVGATCFTADGTTFVPALGVKVVEAVGAGDAFAAGFLSGLLDGKAVRDRLRLGHILAGATLQSVRDLAPFPDRHECARMLAAEESEWTGLRLSEPPRP